MGLEERNGKFYYYRKIRQGQRVLSEYIGTKDAAQAIGDFEAIFPDKRKVDRSQELQEIERIERAGLADEGIFGAIEAMTKVALLSVGCHQHKGTWRVKRNEKS